MTTNESASQERARSGSGLKEILIRNLTRSNIQIIIRWQKKLDRQNIAKGTTDKRH